MAIHSSILAWRISGTDEPGGLQSMELPDKTEQLSIQSCMPRNRGKHRKLEEAEK